MSQFLTNYYRVFFTVCIVAIAGLSFYVGILYGKQEGGGEVTLSCSDTVLSRLVIPTQTLAASVTTPPSTDASVHTAVSPAAQGAFAGSKNGTKYYTPGCAGLNRIKPENIIWFQSAEDATLQGYTRAAC